MKADFIHRLLVNQACVLDDWCQDLQFRYLKM